MATLIPARTSAPRAARGQRRGIAASSRPAEASTAAAPPKLSKEPVDSAAAGSSASRTAAASVSAAPGRVERSSARAAAPAASMIQARRLGGSAPDISA